MMLLILFTTLLPLPLIMTDLPCHQLPHSDYLSAQQLDRVCEHRREWLNQRNQHTGLTPHQRAYIKSLSPPSRSKRALNTPSPKIIRREYRMMSPEQRSAFNSAVNVLKSKMIDNISVWDLHTIIHYPDSAVGAHWGPAFLPWHREFLRQLETSLRGEVEGATLPFWDSTLDSQLPDPSDSVMWSDELMGNGNGYVRTGPFKEWNTNVFMPLSPVPVKKLYRSTGQRQTDRLLSERDVEWIVGRKNFSDLTFCHDKTFESMHGLSHVWVGGFMFVIRVSPNDPTFYMHHALIDNLWEQFRQRQQTRKQRERDYASKTCNKNHDFNSRMAPFALLNRDGMSNDYTDFWYEYEPIRHCSQGDPTCDSPYLFCDTQAWRCRSRIVLGGNCTGYEGMEICYKSRCIQQVCRAPLIDKEEEEGEQQVEEGVVWTKTLLLGEDWRPLVSGVAHILVGEGNGTRRRKVYAQKGSQYPELQGTFYLPLPSPTSSVNSISLEARDHYGRYCQSYCMNGSINAYQVCEPLLHISSTSRPPSSSNISFTHSISSRVYLDVDLSVHPYRWKIYTPSIVFVCHRHQVQSEMIKEIGEAVEPPKKGEQEEYVWFRVSLLKTPSSNISLDDLKVEVVDLSSRSSSSSPWTSPVRRARSSYDPSLLFLRAPNPSYHPNSVDGTKVEVVMRLGSGGARADCEVRCSSTAQSQPPEGECTPTIVFHKEEGRSQEGVYTVEPRYLQLLGWRMVGHPSEWRLTMPYLAFYC